MSPPKKGELSEAEQKLLDAIIRGSLDEAQALMKEPGLRVDCLDETGMTPLQHAAFRGRVDIGRLLLAHGANVNSSYHDNGYSTLMFACLSGSAEVTRLMLEAGANPDHINSVNRTAAQMAAFVGQHQCVSVINSFFPNSGLDHYTKPQGLETEPKLPPEIAPFLVKLINTSSLNPVKLSLYLQTHSVLLEKSYNVTKVLDSLCEKAMKARDTNEQFAMKTNYLSTLISQAAKSYQEKDGNLDFWIKKLLRGRDGDAFPEFQEKLVRQALKDFPYTDSQLLMQLIRSLSNVKIGDSPTALSALNQSINGQTFAFAEETGCIVCGEPKAVKKCSACKMANYCNQQCQKMHWFTHKKFCKELGEEYIKLEKRKKKLEEQDRKNRELAEKQKKEEEECERQKKEEAEDKITPDCEQTCPEIDQCNVDVKNSLEIVTPSPAEGDRTVDEKIRASDKATDHILTDTPDTENTSETLIQPPESSDKGEQPLADQNVS